MVHFLVFCLFVFGFFCGFLLLFVCLGFSFDLFLVLQVLVFFFQLDFEGCVCFILLGLFVGVLLEDQCC